MIAEGVHVDTLADGSVRVCVKYRTTNGVPRTRRGFRSERDALRWRTQTLAAVYRGEIVAVRGTFAERFARLLEEHRPRIEPGTYRDYRVHGENRLKPFFGAMKPATITPSDVRRYVAGQVNGGAISPKTINDSLAVLRVFFAHLEQDGDVLRNPARGSPGARERIKPAAPHREMGYLRIDEIPRYLDACNDVYRPLAETLIATGVRISEALALTWDDIDRDCAPAARVALAQARGSRLDEGRSLPRGRLRRAPRGRDSIDRAHRLSGARPRACVPRPARRRALALRGLARHAQATPSRTRSCAARCACTTSGIRRRWSRPQGLM